jgi:hypothetical protein
VSSLRGPRRERQLESIARTEKVADRAAWLVNLRDGYSPLIRCVGVRIKSALQDPQWAVRPTIDGTRSRFIRPHLAHRKSQRVGVGGGVPDPSSVTAHPERTGLGPLPDGAARRQTPERATAFLMACGMDLRRPS